MNAAVRAVVRAGIYNGLNVYGVYKGYEGLLNGDLEQLQLVLWEILCKGRHNSSNCKISRI